MISKFPTVGMLGNGLWTCCLNFTTIQRWMSPRSSFFWDRFDGLREKERVLGEEERKNEIGRQRRLKSQSENWPSMSLFITKGIHDLLFTLFIYFYYFIKKNSILFSIKWIIKYLSYFLSNHYFIITIFLYLFNHKTSLFSKILYTKKKWDVTDLLKGSCIGFIGC